MNIHEYQAKAILAHYHVPVLRGKVAYTPEEAVKNAIDLGGKLWVVKAQIHAGGRGKAGGVVLCRSLENVKEAAEKLLKSYLVTPQTGPQGQQVHCLYIEEGCDYKDELYFSLILDRSHHCLSFIVSPSGGVNIEEIHQQTPEKILTFPIDPASGFQPYHGRKMAFALGLTAHSTKTLTNLAQNLYRLCQEKDIALIEINPLVVTKSDGLMVLDAKVTFDDNALFRHQDIVELRDELEETPSEREAAQQGLNYVKLEGNIGCMVNGAGLAMATMDIIKLQGGEPANFLDVGGGASQDKVSAAFKLLLTSPNVKAIFVNIFGGIMRCDVIAKGIVAAAQEVNLSLPMIVRLQGTEEKEGKKILKDANLPIMIADDLEEAAIQVVQAAQGIF